MPGKLKAAVYVVLTVALSFLVLTIASRDISASTWEAEYSTTSDNNAPGANPNTSALYAQDGSPNEKHANFAKVVTTHAPAAFEIAIDSAIQDGLRVGQITSLTNLSILGGSCIIGVTVIIPFMDATTDVFDTVDMVGTGANLVFDDDADDTPGEAEDSNGVPTYADHYPSYLNAIFDPDGPAGPLPPLAPRARYVGHTEVLLNAPPTILNFVVFSPGDVGDASFGLPDPEAGIDDSYGYVNYVVLNNPTAPAAPSTITGFCTPLNTDTALNGFTKGEYRVVDGPEPIEVSAFVNQCTVVLPGPTATIIPQGVDDDADTVADDGCLFIDDPCVDVDYTGDTTVDVAQGEDPAPASDDDTDGTVDEGCSTRRIENPAPLTGIYGTGTHLARGFSHGYRDTDNDGVDNEDDNCPIHANGPDAGPENQVDTDSDGLGDLCDPAPGVASPTALPPDALNNDGDSWPNPGGYDPTLGEDGLGAGTCSDGIDNGGGDGADNNDADDCIGDPEAGPECTGAAGNIDLPHKDDDGDGVINDGCGAALNEDPVDNADNDGDTLLDEDGECKATSGLGDEDQDCYANAGDTCPLVRNDGRTGDEGGAGGTSDAGPTSDQIGDQCEPDWNGNGAADEPIVLVGAKGEDDPTNPCPAGSTGNCGTAAACAAADVVDDDADGFINDGCPPVDGYNAAGSEDGAGPGTCSDGIDNSGTDARADRGDPDCVTGRSEVGAECSNDTNDDKDTQRTITTADDTLDDTVVNDGCPAVGGGIAEGHYHSNTPIAATCIPDPDGADDTDNNGDSDNDDDGWCDSTEDLLGSDKDADTSVPEYIGIEYDGIKSDENDDHDAADAGDTSPSICTDRDIYGNVPPAAEVDNDGLNGANSADPNCAAIANDADNDGVPDADDNCPNDDNPEQIDSDGDGTGDDCDTDDDNDGIIDAYESYMGTDPKDDCPDSSTDDAWPFDIVINDVADVTDVLTYGGVILEDVDDPGLRRWDLNASRKIDVTDVLFYGAVILNNCMDTQAIQLTNNTGGNVDDIHIEFPWEVTRIKSVTDNQGGTWSTGASLPAYTLDFTRDSGTLTAGGIVTLKLDGKRTPVQIRCYDWTSGGVVVNSSDMPCRMRNTPPEGPGGLVNDIKIKFSTGKSGVVVNDAAAVEISNCGGPATPPRSQKIWDCDFSAAVNNGQTIKIRVFGGVHDIECWHWTDGADQKVGQEHPVGCTIP